MMALFSNRARRRATEANSAQLGGGVSPPWSFYLDPCGPRWAHPAYAIFPTWLRVRALRYFYQARLWRQFLGFDHPRGGSEEKLVGVKQRYLALERFGEFPAEILTADLDLVSDPPQPGRGKAVDHKQVTDSFPGPYPVPLRNSSMHAHSLPP